jgi:hypothetical protein
MLRLEADGGCLREMRAADDYTWLDDFPVRGRKN